MGLSVRATRAGHRQVDCPLDLSGSVGLYLGLGVSFADAQDAAVDPRSFADSFLASGVSALPLLVAAVALSALITFLKRGLRPGRYGSLRVWDSMIGGLGYAFINPFHGLSAPFTSRKTNDLTGILWLVSKTYSIFHFCWAVALIAYITIGLIAVAR